jgi:putative NADPH-quinone reductase
MQLLPLTIWLLSFRSGSARYQLSSRAFSNARCKHGRFVQILKGKSARIIVTMGMPGFVYRWWFGAHAVKMLRRNILGLIGVHPIRAMIYGSIEGVRDERRRRWLRDIEALGREAA